MHLHVHRAEGFIPEQVPVIHPPGDMDFGSTVFKLEDNFYSPEKFLNQQTKVVLC